MYFELDGSKTWGLETGKFLAEVCKCKAKTCTGLALADAGRPEYESWRIPFLEVAEPPPSSERLFMYFPTSGSSLQHSPSNPKDMPGFLLVHFFWEDTYILSLSNCRWSLCVWSRLCLSPGGYERPPGKAPLCPLHLPPHRYEETWLPRNYRLWSCFPWFWQGRWTIGLSTYLQTN